MTTDRKPGTTKEEEKMYAVMEAIFDSGIPISFKGSMVMKAFLVQAVSSFGQDIRVASAIRRT